MARLLTTNQLDTAEDTALNWGGPFPQGALMAMGDVTVRLFPYHSGSDGIIYNGCCVGSGAERNQPTEGLGAIPFCSYLTPTGGESVCIPDR